VRFEVDGLGPVNRVVTIYSGPDLPAPDAGWRAGPVARRLYLQTQRDSDPQQNIAVQEVSRKAAKDWDARRARGPVPFRLRRARCALSGEPITPPRELPGDCTTAASADHCSRGCALGELCAFA
jgi:hypothetical protein